MSTLPDLAGVPVHPTPLYSIAANVVTGLLLTRLWARGASPGLVLGLFLVLNGLARFVEEAYRAEPQTPVVAGLRLYQWLAALSVAAGIVATTVESGPPAMPFTAPDTATVAAAAALGLVVAAALSMDFPRSSRRFSRLGPPGPARG